MDTNSSMQLQAAGNPQQGYSGVVQVQGQPVQVQNGEANFGGQTYYVSHDGSMVVDAQRNLLGHVQGGQFMPTTDEHVAQLRGAGLLENL